jgi:hypothetical protein
VIFQNNLETRFKNTDSPVTKGTYFLNTLYSRKGAWDLISIFIGKPKDRERPLTVCIVKCLSHCRELSRVFFFRA